MHHVLSFRCIHGPLGIFLAFSSLAFAQSTAPEIPGVNAQQSAYQSSIAQEAVRRQADKIQAEINELVTELKLNGLDNADVTILSNASNHLKNLSQEDMQKVINALQSASMNAHDQDRQQSLVSAYQEQQVVSLKLKSLATDLAAQESQKEIPSKLENLIARQSANMRQTATLPAGVATVDQLDARQKSTHDVVSSEQASIGGEIDLLFKVLAATPDASTQTGVSDMIKAVLETMNGSALKDLAGNATRLTSAGPFPDAVTEQTAVRNDLTAALRAAMSNVDPVAQLEQAKAQLSQVVNDQKDLASVTRQSKLDGSTLAERQAKINDQVSVTQALLKSISPAASNQLNQAQQAMQQSSDALAKAKNPVDAAPQQQAVADALQKTESLLDQQIASAQQEENQSPTDKLAQLQQLQNEINQAQKNPQTSAADLQKLQQDALAPSPQAANKIADAADQLQKPQPDPAAANQALAQANAAVQQQEDALKQAAQAYQALNQASQQLAKAQQEAAAANQAMQNNANLTEAAHDLTQAQANVAQMNQTPPPGGLPSGAQQTLQQASDALKNATMQAVQAQGAGAQAQDQKAMAAMQQAQAGLGQAMAQIQQQAQGQGQGQPQPGQQQKSQSSQAVAADAPRQGSQLLGGTGAGGVAQVNGGLTSKDREAIAQYQAEKAPPEYAPQVQQYLKNLADSSSETH